MPERRFALETGVDDLSRYRREELVTHFATLFFFPFFFGFAFAMGEGEGQDLLDGSHITHHASDRV